MHIKPLSQQQQAHNTQHSQALGPPQQQQPWPGTSARLDASEQPAHDIRDCSCLSLLIRLLTTRGE